MTPVDGWERLEADWSMASSRSNSPAQSLQTFTERCRRDMDQVSKFVVETQTDLQARESRIDELAESIFHNGVMMEHGLQGDGASVKSRPLESGIKTEVSPKRDRRHEKDLQCFEEELRKQQNQFERTQEDAVKHSKAIRNYLSEVHEMVAELYHRQEASRTKVSQKRPRMTALLADAQKGDVKVEAQSSDVCRIGGIILIGGKEARTVLAKGSLNFSNSVGTRLSYGNSASTNDR